jgi:hypothetical protein
MVMPAGAPQSSAPVYGPQAHSCWGLPGGQSAQRSGASGASEPAGTLAPKRRWLGLVVGVMGRFVQNRTPSRKLSEISDFQKRSFATVIARDGDCWKISFQNPVPEPVLKAIAKRTPR